MARTDVDPTDEPATPDLTAAAEGAASLVPPEVLAQTLGQYVRGQFLRIKSGEAGVLPVIMALIVVTIVFQAVSPNHVFLTAGNIVNLLQQSAVFILLGLAEIFVLLLGEIDLSIGFVGATGAAITFQLIQPVTNDWPWWAAMIVGLAASGLVGAVWGTLVTRLRLPSFIVTLAGLLIFNGALLEVLGLGPFSGILSLNGRSSNLRTIYNLMWGHVTPTAGWIAMIVIVALFGGSVLARERLRRQNGLVAPPVSVTLIKIAFVGVLGVAVVLICNRNRPRGVPWFVFIVLGVLALWTFLLGRTRFGRYLYAIGGNKEAARRAGINVTMVVTGAFVLCSVTAGLGGIFYGSQLGGISNNVDGGQLVLYAVAAAVIGGTSLFGGRGKPSHAVIGGLMIGAIYNGMGLLGLDVRWQFIVTGGVLLFAVTVDSLTRRGSSSGSATRV